MARGLAVLALALFALAAFAACGEELVDANNELVIMSHDSFNIGEEVIAAFEAANDATVVLLPAGDTGFALNRAILEKGNPSADLFYGVDNTYLGRALDEGIFQEYESPNLEFVPERFHMDPSNHVTPIDYGYVNLNYDKAYLEENGLQPPTSLEELTQEQWRGKLAVENPATSSPGLAFLIATVSYFGEDDGYDYRDFWADLRANDVAITDGWETAYYTNFSKNGGDQPLVVSYATSPAAEFIFSETPLEEPPTGNILFDRSVFLQIEGMGVLEGADSPLLARKFIDFALELQFQEDFPDKMFVYPVNRDATLPDFWRFAEEPAVPSDIGPDEIGEKREAWIEAWTQVMLR